MFDPKLSVGLFLPYNPRFQGKFQCARGAKMLRFDWLVAKFGPTQGCQIEIL